MGEARIICEAAEELILKRAVRSADGFRQWVYPILPKNYVPNPEVAKEVEAGMRRGLSAVQIAEEVYKRHS